MRIYKSKVTEVWSYTEKTYSERKTSMMIRSCIFKIDWYLFVSINFGNLTQAMVTGWTLTVHGVVIILYLTMIFKQLVLSLTMCTMQQSVRCFMH